MHYVRNTHTLYIWVVATLIKPHQVAGIQWGGAGHGADGGGGHGHGGGGGGVHGVGGGVHCGGGGVHVHGSVR